VSYRRLHGEPLVPEIKVTTLPAQHVHNDSGIDPETEHISLRAIRVEFVE
jgi:hypothetical protein